MVTKNEVAVFLLFRRGTVQIEPILDDCIGEAGYFRRSDLVQKQCCLLAKFCHICHVKRLQYLTESKVMHK